jgi:isopenicillin-N epimerase
MERQPVTFFSFDLENLLADARAGLAKFIGTDPERLAFVANATTGVNTVVRSLTFQPGDELLVTDQEYQACRNAVDYAAERCGAKTVVANIPFPLKSPDEVVNALLAKVTPRTKLLLCDHVTSQTGLVFPIERIVAEMKKRGVDTLVDGAHAPGMVPLNLDALGAAYYTGNCHKWLCAPKGAAFLNVRQDKKDQIFPLTISHGYTSPLLGRSRFRIQFDWMGTLDPTAWLTVPAAIDYMGSLLPGGWPALMKRNHDLAMWAQKMLCESLGTPIPAPESMIGSMAAIPVKDSPGLRTTPPMCDPLQYDLMQQYKIELPVILWPDLVRRFFRISAQIYNTPAQYEKLAAALKELL